jgi:hypothetical protein
MKLRFLPLALIALLAFAACASNDVKREPKAPGQHTNHHHD